LSRPADGPRPIGRGPSHSRPVDSPPKCRGNSEAGHPRLGARVRESHSVRAVRESLERLEAKLGVRAATDAVARALDESA
jgi:hypothetical protein